MNVDNGQLLRPRLEPDLRPIRVRQAAPPSGGRDAIFGTDSTTSGTPAPIFDRAIQGVYPTGSTFKPITALAALDAGLHHARTRSSTTTGSFDLGDGNEFHNAGDAANGSIDLQRGAEGLLGRLLLHARLPHEPGRRQSDGGRSRTGRASSASARRPGSTSPARAPASVPTPEQRNAAYKTNTSKNSPAARRSASARARSPTAVDGGRQHQPLGRPGRPAGDPLQMAIAYAAIANGGDLVRPHVGLRVEDPQGRTIQEIDPAAARQVDIDPSCAQHDPRRAARRRDGAGRHVLPGLRRLPGRDRRQDRNRRAAGQADQSWYIALAPYDDPKYVVVLTIERGGFGVDTAAPAAQEILDALLRHQAQVQGPTRRARSTGPRTSDGGLAPPTSAAPSIQRARACSSALGLRPASTLLLVAGDRR